MEKKIFLELYLSPSSVFFPLRFKKEALFVILDVLNSILKSGIWNATQQLSHLQ